MPRNDLLIDWLGVNTVEPTVFYQRELTECEKMCFKDSLNTFIDDR